MSNPKGFHSVIKRAHSLALHRRQERNTLFVVGTYTIGKVTDCLPAQAVRAFSQTIEPCFQEKVFEAIARALQLKKIFVEPRKKRVSVPACLARHHAFLTIIVADSRLP